MRGAVNSYRRTITDRSGEVPGETVKFIAEEIELSMPAKVVFLFVSLLFCRYR